jgi:hypothetical protein
MRFMVMHKVDETMERGEPPSPEMLQAFGQLAEDGYKAGVFLMGEGLKPTAHRVRLTFARGKRTVTRGPLTGGNELITGFLLLKVATIDEAIAWATRLAEVTGDREIELGPVTEPWDLGFAPKPPDAPLRVLLLPKADARYEAGQPRSPQQAAGLAALKEVMTKDGVLLAHEELLPSARGQRLQATGATVTDGPFAESKEMIAGFAILQLPSLEEVLPWAWRFAACCGAEEMDVRPVVEPPSS